MTDTARGPDVRVPPPLFFIAGWLVGWALHLAFPVWIDGDGSSPTQDAIGAALVVCGLAVMFWGLLTFVRCRTPVVPVQAARTLVIRGPYRFSRNPMYVGLTLAYSGAALLFNVVWPLLVLPVVLVVMTTMVIRREERHLQEMFGEAYAAYRGRVRRWI